MNWFVYILRCEDNSFYTGVTPDLQRCFREHRDGKGGRYTRSHKPEKILYYESFGDQKSALQRERQIKGWTREKKELLIKGILKPLPA